MWEDVSNNPKQGNAFRKFRGELMNVIIKYDDEKEKANTSNQISGVEVKGENL